MVRTIDDLLRELWHDDELDHYQALFEGLMQDKRPQPKASAMETRYLQQGQSGGEFEGLEIFESLESTFYEELSLPVDRIIERIMHEISDGQLKSFIKINYAIRNRYNSN